MRSFAFSDCRIFWPTAPCSSGADWILTTKIYHGRRKPAAHPFDLERDFMKKEMLINVLQPEECRIAIVEDGILEELYVERTSHESYVGNIYKGRIVNIEPSIQAAFVDFGVGRNGFLHVSDVEPAYYRHLEDQRDGNGRRGGRGGRDRRPQRRQDAYFEDDLGPEREEEPVRAEGIRPSEEIAVVSESETLEERYPEPLVPEA